jgi:hypothetical protein
LTRHDFVVARKPASFFDFPDPVNDVSARLVASGVVVLASIYVGTGGLPVLAALAYGFVARVLCGPRFSPLALLVTRGITPRLRWEARLLPGPPKRFAQGMGATFSLTALLLVAAGQPSSARVLIGLLAAAAFLEASLGYCLGCRVFGLLMRAGVIPETVCETCNDVSLRLNRIGTGT